MCECRFVFLDCPGCEKCAAPDPIAVKLDRFEANAASRAEQARQGRLTLLAVWVVCAAALAWSVAVGPMRAEAQFQSDLRR